MKFYPRIVNKTRGIQKCNSAHKLIEIWRKTNPSQRYFIYHNADNNIHSRLDSIYITKAIKTKKCKIVPNSLSDQHHCLCLPPGQ